MVEFGKTLAKSKRPEWAECYLNYDRLKNLLQQAKEERNKQRQHHRRSSSFSIIFGNNSSNNNNDGGGNNNNNNNTNSNDPETAANTFQKDQFHLLEFRRMLDLEIEKVVLFSLEEQGRLSQQLTRLAPQRETCLAHVASIWQDYHLLGGNQRSSSSPKLSLIRETHQAYQQVAYQVLEYVQYVELNVTAVRKILKKHDKNHHPPLSQQYLSRLTTTTTITGHVDSHLDQLYQFGGVSALIATLQRAFAELHQVECFILLLTDPELPLPPSMVPTTTTTTIATTTTSSSYRSRSVPMLSAMSASTSSAAAASTTMVSMVTTTMVQGWDSCNNDPSKPWIPLPSTTSQPHPMLARLVNTTLTVPTKYTVAREPILDQIHAARSKLQQSTKYVELVAAQSLFFEDDAEEEEEDCRYPKLSTLDPTQKQKSNISSLLNLASTFLYMTNYYIVAPTTGNYAIKLGSSEAMAGIIIGMTPNAALVATVLYAWWSNHSYKSALLFAAGCSFAGNVAYAMALNFHSLELVMIGRFLNGFGSARSINRRFIADTFSREDRTAASAAFVTAAALGMAAGPAIATALAQVHSKDTAVVAATASSSSSSPSVWWTEETAPGWVMMVAWLGFFVAALLYFEEPDRSHIFGKGTTPTAVVATPGETQPLLDDFPAKQLPLQRSKAAPWFGNIPVMVTLWIYFVLKLVLECLLSSCGIVTKYYFDWDSQQSAAFLAFLGLLMFPANMGVARLSQIYEDRELIRGTLLVMLISVLGIFVYNANSYSNLQYMVFGVCIFLSTNVLEGPNMSLLSKTVPKQWARGIFNSGFLATEAGTAARSVGDVLISAVAFRGVDNLLNSTFLPLLLLVVLSLVWTTYFFESLVEDDDEEGSLHTQPSVGTNTKDFHSQISSETLESNKSFGK